MALNRANFAAITSQIAANNRPQVQRGQSIDIAGAVNSYLDGKRQAEEQQREREKYQRFLQQENENKFNRDEFVKAFEAYNNGDTSQFLPAYARYDPNGAAEFVIKQMEGEQLKPTEKMRNFEYFAKKFGEDKAAEMIRGGTTVNVGGTNDFLKQDAKNMADYYKKANEANTSAAQNLAYLEQLGNAVDNPAVYQGIGGEMFNSLRTLASSLGADLEGMEDAKLIPTISSQLLGQLRRDVLSGATSDRDINFLLSMVPSLSNTPEQNRAIVNMYKKAYQRQAEVFDLMNQYRDQNGGVLDYRFNNYLREYYKDKPLFTEEERAAAMGKGKQQQQPQEQKKRPLLSRIISGIFSGGPKPTEVNTGDFAIERIE